MPDKLHPDNSRDVLNDVLTRAEAARLWCRHPETIQYAIDRGKLAARRTGRGWLITRASLVALYGPAPTRKRTKNLC